MAHRQSGSYSLQTQVQQPCNSQQHHGSTHYQNTHSNTTQQYADDFPGKAMASTTRPTAHAGAYYQEDNTGVGYPNATQGNVNLVSGTSYTTQMGVNQSNSRDNNKDLANSQAEVMNESPAAFLDRNLAGSRGQQHPEAETGRRKDKHGSQLRTNEVDVASKRGQQHPPVAKSQTEAMDQSPAAFLDRNLAGSRGQQHPEAETGRRKDKNCSQSQTNEADIASKRGQQHPPVADPDMTQYKQKKSESTNIIEECVEEIESKHINKHRHCYSEEDYKELRNEYRKCMGVLKDNNETLQLKVTVAKERADKMEEQLRAALAVIEQQKKESDDLCSRLAAEMSDKVSTNETSIENVSIRNRPTKVTDEYNKFCSETWLSAKQTLDDVFKGTRERTMLKFLCEILMVGYEKATGMQALSQNRIQHVLLNPLEAKTDLRQTMEAEDIDQFKMVDNTTAKKASMNRTARLSSARSPLKTTSTKPVDRSADIPVNVHNTIGDFLRLSADDTDLTPLIQSIEAALKVKWNKSMEYLKDNSAINDYIDISARICWKMVNQRPMMTFETPDIGQQANEDVEHIQWGSTDPKDPRSVVVCYVYPILCHGEKIMAKGKVYLQHKQSS